MTPLLARPRFAAGAAGDFPVPSFAAALARAAGARLRRAGRWLAADLPALLAERGDALRDWEERGDALRELLAIDERLLIDIGTSRAEILARLAAAPAGRAAGPQRRAAPPWRSPAISDRHHLFG